MGPLLTKMIFASALLPMLIHVTAFCAQACDVVAVRSFNSSPYNNAIKGFEASSKCSVSVIDSDAGRSAVLREIRDKDPDAVLVVGQDALNAVQSITGIPVFFTMVVVSELQVSGLPQNFYGLSMESNPESHAKTLSDLFPKGSTVGVLYDPKHLKDFVVGVKGHLDGRGIKTALKEVLNAASAASAMESLKDRIDVLWLPADTTIANEENIKAALLFSMRNRIPIYTFSRKYVEKGAFAALQTAPYDLGLQLGEAAAKTINGKTLPKRLEYPVRHTLLVNRKMAKKYGIDTSMTRRTAFVE
ncbi:MAG: hypothetical protein EPN22_15010 [Nitrospirae bacterium]|nr:MAG: hypothetical protein EPN22_15010 [Nitrospirota bacterium]